MTVGLSPFPTPVPTRDDPDNFDERADATLAHLPVFVDELNASIAGIDQAVAAAAGSKSAAATSASEAASSVTKASRWSDAAVGVVVEAGRYSARHWSDVADRFANAAKGVEVTPGKYSAFHWAEMAKDIANVVAYTVAFTPVQNLKSTNVQSAIAEVDAATDYLRALALRQAYGNGPYPTLDLQFTGAGVLDPRVSFSRGSTKTSINRFGLLETLPVDKPDFAFDAATGRARGLLIESKATNLLLWSSDPSRAVWGRNGINFGAVDARGWVKLIETGAVGSHFVLQQTTKPADGLVCGSAILKRGERRYAQLRLVAQDASTAGTQVRATYDLQEGLVTEMIASGLASDIAASMKPSHDGGWECVLAGNPGGAGGNGLVRASFYLMEGPTGTSVYAGDGSSGLYFRASQLEEGVDATSNIPTQASQITRLADDVKVNTVPLMSFFNADQGTFVVKGWSPRTKGINPLFSADDGGIANRMQIRQNASNSRPSFLLAAGGTLHVNDSPDWPWPGTSVARGAISYAKGQASFALNGVAATKASEVPPITQLVFGTAASFSTAAACIESIQYYPRSFNASQLATLTA